MFSSKKRVKEHKGHTTAVFSWVTKSGIKYIPGAVAIRSTSDTIVYPVIRQWVRSYRDLPIKVNQWINVDHYQDKDVTPFIKSREELWQEGYSVHSTRSEAERMVLDVLDIYKKIYEEILAVPVIKGIKSEERKLPGALYTTNIETINPANGKGIEAACSHNLGQNMAKLYEIYFQNQKHSKELAWQTFWNLSIKAVGIIVLVHGDDKGVILPPRIAPIQVVLIPSYSKPFERDKLTIKLKEIAQDLQSTGILTKVDERVGHNSNWKHYNWEVKGVPLRIELGLKEQASECVILTRRDTGEKKTVKWIALKKEVNDLLELIQKQMLENAKKAMAESIINVTTWEQCMYYLKKGKSCLAPWYFICLFNQQ